MAAEDLLHSLMDYECLLFCVIDLVLIYESVTSSASVVRWLTLHGWTMNSPTTESIRARVRVRVILRLAVYLQSVRLGENPLETHDTVI
jgi:hypothetical protein